MIPLLHLNDISDTSAIILFFLNLNHNYRNRQSVILCSSVAVNAIVAANAIRNLKSVCAK